MIETIKSTLMQRGELTCQQLASATGTSAKDLIAVLRQAVGSAELCERNGFYDVFRSKPGRTARRSFAWIEGTEIPRHVLYLASGPRPRETIFVLAELDTKKRQLGWPQFVPALIDARLGHFHCCSGSQIISGSVVRYLPIDTSGVA